MPHSTTHDADNPARPADPDPNTVPVPGNPEPPPSRYDANLQLIRRRLKDEQRTTATRHRPWWKKS